MTRATSLMFLAFALCACAGARNYTYVPMTTGTSALDSSSLAVQEHVLPQGALRVFTHGLRPIDGYVHGKHLMLRIQVENRSQHTWTLRPERQHLLFAGNPRAPELIMGETPIIVQPGAQRQIDLAYRVIEPVSRFELGWELETHRHLVSARLPFRRLELEPPQALASLRYRELPTPPRIQLAIEEPR